MLSYDEQVNAPILNYLRFLSAQPIVLPDRHGSRLEPAATSSDCASSCCLAMTPSFTSGLSAPKARRQRPLAPHPHHAAQHRLCLSLRSSCLPSRRLALLSLSAQLSSSVGPLHKRTPVHTSLDALRSPQNNAPLPLHPFRTAPSSLKRGRTPHALHATHNLQAHRPHATALMRALVRFRVVNRCVMSLTRALALRVAARARPASRECVRARARTPQVAPCRSQMTLRDLLPRR